MTPPAKSTIARRWVLPLYALSGLLSLGCQTVWFRVFAERYGATPFTFGLVVLCFIGALGAGAWHGRRFTGWLGRRAGIRSPFRLYGAVELLAAAGLALTFVFQLVSLPPAGVDAYSFPHVIDGGLEVWRIRLIWKLIMGVAAALVLAVPCFFMGMTFPLLCSAFQRDSRFPSELYASNTLGACLGVVACEFLLIAKLGHHATFVLLFALNAALGAVFFWGAAGKFESAEESTPLEAAANGDAATEADAIQPVTALTLAGLSGLIAGALEADLFQQIRFSGYVLSAGMSFVSFWAILAIFLGSLTARSFRRARFNRLKAAALLAPVLYLIALTFRYELRDGIAKVFLPYSLDAPAVRTPHYMDAGLTPLFLFSGVLAFPAFYLISLILPHACNRLQAAGRPLGRAYAINTFAFCAGLFGFSFLAPRVDLFYAFKLFLVFFVLAVGTVVALRKDGKGSGRKLAIGFAAIIGAVIFTPRGFDARFFDARTAAGITGVRALRSNGASTTYVVTDANYPGERLYFDGYSMSGTAPGDQQYMRLMAHVPLLAQPNPTSALQIGFGVGSTASAVALHDSIQRFDIVDLNHQVLATASEFAENNRNVLADSRVRLFHDDGRNFLRLTTNRYDLVTSEPPPPIFEGVFRLYSKEYYELVLARLTPSGMMTQWLPMNQLSQESSAWIARSFVQTFPYSLAFVGYADHVILLGSAQPISPGMIERRFRASPKIVAALDRFGVRSPAYLLARVIADDASLKQDYGEGPVIHDANSQFAHLIRRDAQPQLNFRPAGIVGRLDALACREELISIWTRQAALVQVAPDYPFWLIRLAEE